MAPRRPTAAWLPVIGLISLLATCTVAAPAHALKVATWNLLGYDDGAVPSVITPRQPRPKRPGAPEACAASGVPRRTSRSAADKACVSEREDRRPQRAARSGQSTLTA